jgi:23S rRNA pseudouridine2604 synthase
MQEKRLNKAMSETGFCSRRGADKYIEEGRVKVNGKATELGQKVTTEDEITLDDTVINKEVEKVYLAFNKPTGITCTTDVNEPDNIIDYIDYPSRIFPIGRLDKPSQGLIFMTNDGDIVNKILRSKNNHEKEYIVTVTTPITNEFIKTMSSGVAILDTITKKCIVEKLTDYKFKIILTQGLNRQIRRMCEELEYKISALKRVRIMNINLDDLRVGEIRNFTEEELAHILSEVEDSIMTEEGSEEK